MKTTSLLLLSVIIVCACSLRNHNMLPAGIEVIPVELKNIARDASSFIEKIEIVPLETNDSSLMYGVNKMLYDKKMDMYAIYTRQTVFTFKGNGEYIGNSKKVKGQGPEEYGLVVDVCFNPYLGGIDMLNPYGTIYTYSPTFELLAKRKYTPEFPIDRLMALDSANYIFTHPFLWTDQELSFVDINTQEVVTTQYEGTITGGNSLNRSCFQYTGENYYFIPSGVNYHGYRIDPEEKKLVPIIYFDFGDEEVKGDGLPGRAAGKRVSTNKERDIIVKECQERGEYISESEFLLPKIKFISEDYIYIYTEKGRSEFRRTFLYNRKTKENFVLAEREPLFIPPCRGLVDNVLFVLSPPELDQISQVIDRKLMSPEEITKMESLDEEDNPVIVKYYLKK